MDWTYPDHPANTHGPWRAGTSAGIAVVAAKVDEGIVRAIDPLAYRWGSQETAHRLIRSVLMYVGVLREDIVWSGCFYPGPPMYLCYDRAERFTSPKTTDNPSGVWLWKWNSPPSKKYIGRTQFDGVYLGPLVPR